MDNFLRQTAAGQPGAPSTQCPPLVNGCSTERLLGAGASAAVWLVRDQATGEALALKVFAAAGPHQDRLTELRREVAILGRLSHPHLLGIRDVLETDQGPALRMPYAGGGSLHHLVTVRGRLAIGETVTILTPVAQALAYLHSQSVLHGDVSPGNVLFTPEGKPLLADLGISRLLGEQDGGPEGTPGFMDPGSRRAARLNLPADVYSLAALGWYSLTGRPPGPARERAPLTLMVPDVPAELRAILEAGLQDDPDLRPSAGEFAHAVIRSAAPAPLDLVPAVHPTVLPELLTRRAARTQPVAMRRWKLRRRADPTGARVPPPRAVRGPRTGTRLGWRTVALGLAAAGLVAAGALTAGPHLLQTTGPTVPAVGAAGDPGSAAGAVAGESEQLLSPEMRERLAGQDPLQVLPALAAVRARAFATADQRLLSHVNVEGTGAMIADQEVVAGLRAQGHVFQDLSVRLERLEKAELGGLGEGAAAVAATAITSGYTVADRGGTTIREVAEATPQNLVFVLERHGELWKIAAVHVADAA